MAKVHPLSSVDVASSSNYNTAKGESFTIWMKSLVMQGNGCTVFNENGEIIYRIDNYDNKGSNEVYLRDLRGKVLFTMLQRFCFFGRWKVYKGDRSNLMSQEKPKFQVTKKGHLILRSENAPPSCYKLEASSGKSAFKIIDFRGGGVVAEARRKQSSSGVLLGCGASCRSFLRYGSCDCVRINLSQTVTSVRNDSIASCFQVAYSAASS